MPSLLESAKSTLFPSAKLLITLPLAPASPSAPVERIVKLPPVGRWLATFHACMMILVLCPSQVVRGLARPLTGYMEPLGIRQGWEFFSHDPSGLDTSLRAVVLLADGRSVPVALPNRGGAVLNLLTYRKAKYFDNVEDKPYYYPVVCRWLAAQYPTALHVQLFYVRRNVSSLGVPPWSSSLVWRYDVPVWR